MSFKWRQYIFYCSFLGDKPCKQNLVYNRKYVALGVAVIHSEAQPTITETFCGSVIHKRMPYENSNTSRSCVGVVVHPHISLLIDLKMFICESRQLVNMIQNINTYFFWQNENLKKNQCYVQPDFSKRGQSYYSD